MKVFARLALALVVLLPLQMGAQQWRNMTFKADAPGIDENPLRGFVPYAGSRGGDLLPYSLEWFYLALSDVVKGDQTYDWSALEARLAAIAARGHQAVFRFYVDYPKKPSGIPRYLLDAGLKTFPYDDDGNATSATPSVAPDYSDPRLQQCFVGFIHALGAKYDGDPRIAYLTVGLYGFWGEWHVHQHPAQGEPAGWTFSQANKDALLKAYVESFHTTLLEVRYGWVTRHKGLLKRFGFEDDSFLRDTLGEEPWRFWKGLQNAKQKDSWKKLPTGGEVLPELEPRLWDAWPNANGQDFASSTATIHPTWMLEAEMFEHPPTPRQRAHALRADRMLGYTFFCERYRVKRRGDGSGEVTLRVENRGVAPMYYAWPVEAEALDAAGKVVGRGQAQWPLPKLLPGKAKEWSVELDALPADATTVVVRIANPMTGGHDVAFADAEMGTLKAGWLTLDIAQH